MIRELYNLCFKMGFLFIFVKKQMKIITLFSIFLFILFFTLKVTGQSEKTHYSIVKKINNIEIRKYEKLIYVSYTPKNEKERNSSFQNIASYIFGGNSRNEKISMTSPVVIKIHNKNEMAFIMPKEYTLNSLPKSNNKQLSIYEESSAIKAAIKYSGYSNKEKEKTYIKKLKDELKKANIKYKNDFELLVYDSPYKFINRRNEIIVSIQNMKEEKKLEDNENKKNHTIHLGGGCFWCVEAVFEGVIGVKNVTSGYSGGEIKNPSYKEVSRGLTKHAEVCKITYDTNKILLEDILKIFFLSHDPTTLNKQGNDIGAHYRSIVLYNSQEEKKRINDYILSIENLFDDKIVTEVKKFNNFYNAEEYHQDYYRENSNAPYCNIVITPKIMKVKKELSKYYSE